MEVDRAYDFVREYLAKTDKKVLELSSILGKAYSKYVTANILFGMHGQIMNNPETSRRQFFEDERPNFLAALQRLSKERGLVVILDTK